MPLKPVIGPMLMKLIDIYSNKNIQTSYTTCFI